MILLMKISTSSHTFISSSDLFRNLLPLFPSISSCILIMDLDALHVVVIASWQASVLLCVLLCSIPSVLYIIVCSDTSLSYCFDVSVLFLSVSCNIKSDSLPGAMRNKYADLRFLNSMEEFTSIYRKLNNTTGMTFREEPS